MSVSALNVLRSQSLPNTDFREPAQVLERLSTTFLMEQHDNRYFTIWYGVFSKKTRQLAFAGGGHPPALFRAVAGAELQRLESQGPPIGWSVGLPFESNVVAVDPSARLFIFSDGVFEIEKTDGENWEFEQFVDFMTKAPPGGNAMDYLLTHARKLHGSDTLGDDFSILELVF